MRRNIKFENDEYYHVYNRGVEKRSVFLDSFDYLRFLKSAKEFNQTNPTLSLYVHDKLVGVQPLQDDKLVEIISYCFLPNHFHFILKQLRDGGISEFMKRLSGGYTGYFNCKYKRSGILFQGRFRSIHVDSNEYLQYLLAYVGGNYLVHGEKNQKWTYSSLNNKHDDICNSKLILQYFDNFDDYRKYTCLVATSIKEKREEIKKYLME